MKELIPYFPALLMDFCLGIVITNTAYFSTSLSLSATFIGVLMSFSTLLFTLFAIPFGKLSDRIGRSRLLSGLFFDYARQPWITSMPKRLASGDGLSLGWA